LYTNDTVETKYFGDLCCKISKTLCTCNINMSIPASIHIKKSSVVRRASTFDVYTVETTFVIRFLCDLVTMFVLTISRPSSNMGHVASKTRSPGQILRNSCLHSRGQICDPIWWNLIRMFVLAIYRPSLYMGHVKK